MNYMTRAFVLFNVDSGFEGQVLLELRKIEEINEAYVSYGTYDLIAKINADTIEQLKDDITHKVRTIKNVKATLTLIITE